MDDIYSMELHDEIEIRLHGRECTVLRVPGGWIYRSYISRFHEFVPYNVEFKPVPETSDDIIG